MIATSEKTAKALTFEIKAPLGMVLSKGERAFEKSADASLWVRFSICPVKYPRQQTIYLVPKEEETAGIARAKSPDGMPRFDLGKRRRLTSEIEGSVYFYARPQADQNVDDKAKPNIGTLSHGPGFSSSDYGHAEFYCIEINLPQNEFRQILDAFLTGRPPKEITIWTPDVEYGGAPDGSDKVWEVWDAHHTFATIAGFTLAFSTDIPRVGVGLKKTEDDEENDAEETTKLKEAILHSREDIQLLCFGQASMNSALAGLRKQINVLIAVVVVIAVIVALGFKW